MSMSLGDLLHQGGIFMVPLLLASMVALGVALDRLIFFLRLERGGEAFRSKLQTMVSGGQRAECLTWLKSLRGPVPAVVLAGLARWDNGRQAAEDAMVLRARAERAALYRYLPVLETTVTASPLVGLLGTITGMMGVFRAVSEKLARNPQADTSSILAGIGEALIATATGILIAVVCLCLHNFFQAWADGQMDAAERAAEEMVTWMPSEEPVRLASNGSHGTRKEDKVAS